MATKMVTVKLPSKIVGEIDKLIGEGFYKDRADFIAEACRWGLHMQFFRRLAGEEIKVEDLIITAGDVGGHVEGEEKGEET